MFLPDAAILNNHTTFWSLTLNKLRNSCFSTNESGVSIADNEERNYKEQIYPQFKNGSTLTFRAS